MGVPFISSHAKKRDHVFAVDLGGRTTKAVFMQRRGERFCLVNYAVVESPVFEKTMTADVLSEHLKEVTRALGNRSKYLTIALGVTDTLFRQVEAPVMPVPDMRQMFKFNSKTYLQQELPDHVFDCQFSLARLAKSAETAKDGKEARAGGKQKVMVGAAKKQIIDTVQAAAKGAGLITEHVVPGMVAPVNAFELAEPDMFHKEVVALVEIGFKNTTITVLDCGEIMLSRVVAIGGDRLTQGLSEALNISYPEAENIKLGMPDEVAQNLESLVHPLGRELRASIDFFENHHDKAVGKVFLSGGSSRSPVVFQCLQAELMVQTELWSPTKTLQLTLPPERMGDIEQTAPMLTVAIGAAAAAF